MNYNKLTKTALVIGALSIAALGTAFADGLLGQRYASAEWVTIDSQDYWLKSSYGANASVNVPVAKGLDATIGYDYQRLSQDGIVFTGQGAAVGLVGFTPVPRTNDRLRVFVGAAVGGESLRVRFGSFKVSERSWIWALDSGIEYEPVKDLSLNVGVSYSEAPDIDAEGEVVYSARAHYWVTSTIGATASFALNEDSDRRTSVGLVYRF